MFFKTIVLKNICFKILYLMAKFDNEKGDSWNIY